jgi:hypothetical protein
LLSKQLFSQLGTLIPHSFFKGGEALVRRLDAALNITISEIVCGEGGVKPPHSKARFARISAKTMRH